MPESVTTPDFPLQRAKTLTIDVPWPLQNRTRNEASSGKPPRLSIDAGWNKFRRKNKLFDSEGKEFLPIQNLVDTDGAHVYLWVLPKFLPVGLALFETWDVLSKNPIIWKKNNGFPNPGTWRYNAEIALFGRVGHLPLLESLPICFDGKVREHSRKPDEFYDLVRRASPEPRIDVFAREKHPGFATWGFETNKFDSGIDNGDVDSVGDER